MKRPRAPLFLGRIPYRRRRLRDAARLLPVFGAFLVILPVLWSRPADGLRPTSGDVVYFFGVWVLLVAVAAAFAPGLSQEDGSPDEDED